MMRVANPPEGYGPITPYLIVTGADEAIGWYQRALGAELTYRMEWGGKVGHAELLIAGGHVMLAEEFPDMGFLSPQTRGGTTVSLLLYVPDVDAAFRKAIAEGATKAMEIVDQPWGDRSGQIIDPYGHRWTIATHVEDVTNEQIDERMAAMQKM